MIKKLDGHSSDCTIYASLINGTPTDGICTCGYGLVQLRRLGDERYLFSKERNDQTNDKPTPSEDSKDSQKVIVGSLIPNAHDTTSEGAEDSLAASSVKDLLKVAADLRVRNAELKEQLRISEMGNKADSEVDWHTMYLELEQQLAGGGWIKCSERLPEGYERVWSCKEDGAVLQRHSAVVRQWSICGFTHWMPILPPPSAPQTQEGRKG